MSAFVVADETINKIVTYFSEDREAAWYRRKLCKLGYDLTKPLSREKLAKDMFFLNCKAVDARYGENQAEEFRPLDFKYRATYGSPEIVILKAIKCWRYQCSEGDEVSNHPLYQMMSDFAGSIAEDIVSRLPDYDNAPWD